MDTLGDLAREGNGLWLHCRCGHRRLVDLSTLPAGLGIEAFQQRARCGKCGGRRPHMHFALKPPPLTVPERLEQLKNFPLMVPVCRHGRVLILREIRLQRKSKRVLYHASTFPEWWVEIQDGILRTRHKTIWACRDATSTEIALTYRTIFADVLKQLRQWE